MTTLLIIVAGMTVLIITLYFYIRVEQEVELIRGTVRSEESELEIEFFDFIPESNFPGHDSRYEKAYHVVEREPAGDTHMGDEITLHAGEHLVSRTVQIEYARQIYVDKPFALVVHLLTADETLPTAPEETAVTKPDPLMFVASEPNPLVEVSLLYADDEFRTARSSVRRHLSNQSEKFEFLLFAREARTCLFTVAINYLRPKSIPERMTQKSVTTKHTSEGVVETTETIVFEPVTEGLKPINVYSVDLPLMVTSVWGLSESQARFWQKGLAPVLVVLLLLLGLLSGQLDVEQTVVMFLVGVADIAGIAVFPDLKKALLVE